MFRLESSCCNVFLKLLANSVFYGVNSSATSYLNNHACTSTKFSPLFVILSHVLEDVVTLLRLYIFFFSVSWQANVTPSSSSISWFIGMFAKSKERPTVWVVIFWKLIASNHLSKELCLFQIRYFLEIPNLCQALLRGASGGRRMH